jgi:SAM-dependent methyltransferase
VNCRSCGGNARQVFTLGNLPLANSLLSTPYDNFSTFPLTLMKCDGCTLIQLDRTVPPDQLFVDYNYLTSCSPPMISHAKSLVSLILHSRQLSNQSLVVEIGSNDGYLLQHYVSHGIPVLGIDPSERAADAASERKVPTLRSFFNSKLGLEMHNTADLVHANNVLAHVPDLNDFVSGLSYILKDDGTLIIEVPYLCSVIDKTAFDQIYHEHIYQFSLTALVNLFQRHDLIITDAEEISVHGGSLRLWIKKHGGVSLNTRRLLSRESFFVGASGYYRDFAARVENCKNSVRDLLDNKRTAGFGAAAKATIFLNVCGITREQIPFVADDTPAKQGKFIPGTGIPIVPIADWLKSDCGQTLILCWNFAQHVAHEYSKTYHGKFFTWYTPELIGA